MPRYDLLLKGGVIMDGARTPRFTGDVAIADGKIAAIWARRERRDAARVFDARELIVAPGFVDLHTHYDSQVFWDPYCTLSGWHGVSVGGDRQLRLRLRPRETRAPRARNAHHGAQRGGTRDHDGRRHAVRSGRRFRNSSTASSATPKGLNMLSYVGLNPLMSYVMGQEAAEGAPGHGRGARRDMPAPERGARRRRLRHLRAAPGPEDGPARLRRHTPMITDTMSPDDFLAFAGVLREKGRGIIQVLGEDMETTERLCEVSGRPVIWNAVVITADQHGVTHGRYKDLLAVVRGGQPARQPHLRGRP